jgi:SSS family solute:Na+ symporter
VHKLFVAPNWLHYEIALFFVVILSMIIISLFTKAADQAAIQGLTLGSATPQQKLEVKNSYNRWDVINSLIIIAITLAFYAYFW